MMPELLQHVLVTLAAILALWVVIRRVFTVVVPTRDSKTCASCPAAQNHSRGQATTPDAAAPPSADAQPLRLVLPAQKPSRRPS